MPTRNVVLTKHQHDFIESLVQTGRYQNASEVLREGLRLIEHRERLHEAGLQALREAAGRGWDDIAAGRYLDVSDDRLDALMDSLGEQAGRLASGRRP